MENIRAFLKDIYDQKFLVSYSKGTHNDVDKIKSDIRYQETKDWFKNKYNIEEYGIKSLIKDFELPMTYSVLRTTLRFFDIKLREPNIKIKRLNELRYNKAINEHILGIGFGSEESIRKVQCKISIARGIQGYYFNKSKNKYVWLRSSSEYTYAKWLDEHNFEWDVEVVMYTLKSGKKYRPDFFIYENNEIKKIVEIKGYWVDKVWKFDEIKEQLNGTGIECILIDKDNIRNYTNNKNIIKEWKQIRILKEQKLKK